MSEEELLKKYYCNSLSSFIDTYLDFELAFDLLRSQFKEIERLNNIINELEKDVKERIDFYKQEIKEFQDDLFTSNYEEIEDAKNEIKIRRCHIIELEDTLDKIEELKGSDK